VNNTILAHVLEKMQMRVERVILMLFYWHSGLQKSIILFMIFAFFDRKFRELCRGDLNEYCAPTAVSENIKIFYPHQRPFFKCASSNARCGSSVYLIQKCCKRLKKFLRKMRSNCLSNGFGFWYFYATTSFACNQKSCI